MQTNESELRRLSDEFVTACFSLLRQTWSLPNVPGRYLLIGRDYSYAGFRGLPEYQAILNYLPQDERVQQTYGQASGGVNHGKLDKYVIGLFQRVFNDSCGGPSPESFEHWFALFRDEIFKTNTVLKEIWFLNNLECTRQDIPLDEELKLRHFGHSVVQQWLAESIDPCSYYNLRQLHGHALILTRAAEKKQVPYVMHHPANYHHLSSVVTALRLFKSGFVDVSHVLTLEGSDFPSESPRVFERNVMGDPFSEKYVLGDSEIENFIQLWKEVYDYLFRENGNQNTNNHRLRTGIAYFESSYCKSWREALVNLAISLEALLLENDDERGKKKKLKSRVSALTSSNLQDKALIEQDISTMYRLRSAVVHGDILEQKKFEENMAKLAGISPDEFDHDKGRSAIEKTRSHVRVVIRKLIDITRHECIELGKPLFSRLDGQNR